MDKTVIQVIRACMPCARTKARFRVSVKELQHLGFLGTMFRWGIDFGGLGCDASEGGGGLKGGD